MIFRNWMILLAQSVLFLLAPVHVWTAEAMDVAVQLKEFKVEAVPQTIKTGEIRFVAMNQGSEEHELVVRKKENGGFKELGEIEPFPPGTTKEMSLALSPGIYELSCQVVEKEEGETVDHYKRGMRVEIEVKDSLRIGGSGAGLGTMRLLAEAFKKSHPHVVVEVPPSLGSGGGIKAVLAGTQDIGLSSRPLKEGERRRGAKEIRYARTPFIIVTSVRNPQKGLTRREVIDVYNRIRRTWDDGSVIRLVLRPESDSETMILRKYFPGIHPSPFEGKQWRGVPVAFSDQKSADLVQTTLGGMGISTLALILSERRPLKALTIDGVAPTPEAILNGSYPMEKTLSFILGPNPSPLAEEFLAFVQSEAGKAILQRTGHLILGEADD